MMVDVSQMDPQDRATLRLQLAEMQVIDDAIAMLERNGYTVIFSKQTGRVSPDAGRAHKPSGASDRPSVEDIISTVAAEHGIPPEEIKGRRRSARTVAARHAAIARAAQTYPEMSTVDLGREFARDHTVIMYALRKRRAQTIAEPSMVSMSVETFCNLYAVRRNLAYDEMKKGRLKFKKAGRRTIIRKVDAEEWLENLPKGQLPLSAQG